MNFEEDSQKEHLLNVYNAFLTPAQIQMYKSLLNALQSRDFDCFKNKVEDNLRKQPPILNINYVYPDHSEQTCLDIASKNGLAKFVEFLLRKGANPNRVNGVHNRAPIHFATEGGHVDALAALLAEQTINPNLKAAGQTALHIAVRKKNIACASLLLDRGARVNVPDNKGMTALHLAATKNQRDMVELLEKYQQYLNRSYQNIKSQYQSDQTTPEVIEEKLPGLLPSKQENREINLDNLKDYLIANDETKFLQNLDFIEMEIPQSVADGLLEKAMQENLYRAALGILEKFRGNLCNVENAAQLAVQQGHHVILRKLLNIKPEIANYLILDACLQLGMPKKQNIDKTSDSLECLKLILKQKNVDVRCIDGEYITMQILQ